MKVGILNAGGGSIFSLVNALKAINVQGIIIKSPDELLNFNRIILPGVGHFDKGSSFIRENDWKNNLDNYLSYNTNRLLGICLGMQMMFLDSEESSIGAQGLGLIPVHCKKLYCSNGWKVPNVGWRSIEVKGADKDFLGNVDSSQKFYFVHSFAVLAADVCERDDLLNEYAITKHSEDLFLSSFRSNNIYGCQFHPEKSSSSGLALLNRFVY